MFYHHSGVRLLYAIALLLATVTIASSKNIDVAPNHALQAKQSFEFRPDVVCQSSDCTLRIVVVSDDLILRSDPLPFQPISAEIERATADDVFGLGVYDNREVATWIIGLEEHAVGLAVERIAIGKNQGLIVHQIAGFDHVNRAHMVLEVASQSLKTHLVVEEIGPEVSDVRPERSGILVTRMRYHEPNLPEKQQFYRWVDDGDGLSLVPAN